MQEYNDTCSSHSCCSANNDAPGHDTSTLTAELDACQLQLKEWQHKFFYISADFENYKKRVSAERVTQLHTAQAELVRKLLPVIDGIERALALPEQTAPSPASMEGIRMVYQTFAQFLQDIGVEEVVATGPFNPERHEALSHIVDSTHQSGDIVQVLQKGYLLKGILIRPALVSVAQ